MTKRDKTVGACLKLIYAEQEQLGIGSMRQVSQRAGLDRDWLRRVVNQAKGYQSPRRTSLRRIAEAMRMTDEQLQRLADVADEDITDLRSTGPSKLEIGKFTGRRGLLLVKAAEYSEGVRDRLIELAEKKGAAMRCSTIFGDNDCMARVTTARGENLLHFVDELYRQGTLAQKGAGIKSIIPFRSTESVLFKDDNVILVNQEPPRPRGIALRKIWAVVLIANREELLHEHFIEACQQAERKSPVRGRVHLQTAAVTVGRFDAATEVFANEPINVRSFIAELHEALKREAELSRGRSRVRAPRPSPVETVTYLSPFDPKETDGSGDGW